MGNITLKILPALQDNYIYLLHDTASGAVATIDPGEPEPVLHYLAEHGGKLTHILCTHHHADHTGGVLPLKRKTGCAVVGFSRDANRIPGLDIRMEDEDSILFAGHVVESHHVPGHTQGSLIFYLPQQGWAFTGDTLFAMGCGRLLEGEGHQLYASLKRIVRLLPEATRIYSGHEYAHGNARFALSVDAGNTRLMERFQQAADNLDSHTPSQGDSLGLELETNPFLRAHIPAIKHSLNMPDASDLEVFSELRRRKDSF